RVPGKRNGPSSRRGPGVWPPFGGAGRPSAARPTGTVIRQTSVRLGEQLFPDRRLVTHLTNIRVPSFSTLAITTGRSRPIPGGGGRQAETISTGRGDARGT